MPAAAPRRAWLTDLPVLLVAVVWGSSYLAAKEVTTAQTVLAVLVLRFAVVLPALIVVGRRKLRAMDRTQIRGAATLGLILAGIFLLETYGVVQTSATNAGLIISLTMILTPIAESRLRGTPLPRSFVAAAALSVLGVVLLTQGAGFTEPSLGDLLMLGAAVARTVHVLAMSRMKSAQGADSLSMTTVQLSAAVLVFALLSAVPGTGTTPWRAAADLSAAGWLGLLYLSAFCTLFAFFVQMWAVRRTSPSRVSLLLGTEPVWAAVVGITLAGDRPGWLGLAGAVLVLVGTWWGRTAAEPAPKAEPEEPAAAAAAQTTAGPAPKPESALGSVVEPAGADGTHPGLEPARRA
ncbi:DMT family transporter [Streptomyces sp. NPDC050145]|uniref:DMT family transporter n=1 Tax=Streptomyces sp. NPDC050145 TaxID=3365602 RepID=UPI0037BB422D